LRASKHLTLQSFWSLTAIASLLAIIIILTR